MTQTVYYWINEVGTQHQRRDRTLHLSSNVIVQATKRKQPASAIRHNRTNNPASNAAGDLELGPLIPLAL